MEVLRKQSWHSNSNELSLFDSILFTLLKEPLNSFLNCILARFMLASWLSLTPMVDRSGSTSAAILIKTHKDSTANAELSTL
jgi:hypothetical protein